MSDDSMEQLKNAARTTARIMASAGMESLTAQGIKPETAELIISAALAYAGEANEIALQRSELPPLVNMAFRELRREAREAQKLEDA